MAFSKSLGFFFLFFFCLKVFIFVVLLLFLRIHELNALKQTLHCNNDDDSQFELDIVYIDTFSINKN